MRRSRASRTGGPPSAPVPAPVRQAGSAPPSSSPASSAAARPSGRRSRGHAGSTTTARSSCGAWRAWGAPSLVSGGACLLWWRQERGQVGLRVNIRELPPPTVIISVYFNPAGEGNHPCGGAGCERCAGPGAEGGASGLTWRAGGRECWLMRAHLTLPSATAAWHTGAQYWAGLSQATAELDPPFATLSLPAVAANAQ